MILNEIKLKMPRKRKNVHAGKEELQIIRTRLIELSMKVEDVVYDKTSITESEAKTFIREVTSYKRKCSREEKSLQVIEKITRCMKAIIAEHQRERLNGHMIIDENNYLGNARANSVSPVYSLLDEDRIQLTQEQTSENIANTTNENKNMYIHNVDNDRTQLTQAAQHEAAGNNDEITEIIKLSDDDDDENNAVSVNESSSRSGISSKINADVDMQKALSNLSLRDVDIQYERMAIDVECSQSILNNFEEINILQHNNISNIVLTSTMPVNSCVEMVKSVDGKVCDQNSKLQNQTPALIIDTNHFVKPITITKSNIKTIGAVAKKYNLNNPLVANESKAINDTFKSRKQLNAKQINTTTTSIIDSDKSNAIIVTKAQNYIQQKCTPATHNQNVSNTYTKDKEFDFYKVHNETPKTVNNLSQVETKTKVRGNVKNQNAIEKKNRKPRIKKNSKIKTIDEIVKIINTTEKHINDGSINKATRTGAKSTYSRKEIHDKKKGIQKDSPIPIYNKNVENDLSWLEGIQFVREVRADEYDCKLTDLNEDFWNNYYLPPNFDGSDFL